MDELNLTKNASAVLKKIQSRYKQRIKEGMSKSDAADFDSSKAIHEELLPKWTFEDVDSACAELLRAKLLDGFRADGYVFRASLSETGIALSEGSPLKNVPKFVGWVLELAQAIRALLFG